MEDKLIESLISSGVPAIVIIAGLYFGKNLIEHFFNETIELKKKELEQENKNFQHQLDTKLQEINIQFSSLHSERAEVIKNLYQKLINLQIAMNEYTHIAQNIDNDEERMENTSNALIAFSENYLPNKIYFSKSIVLKIDNILNEYRSTGWEFTRVLRDIKNPPKYRNSRIDNWDKIFDKVQSYFPSLIEELENDFREILGVKN